MKNLIICFALFSTSIAFAGERTFCKMNDIKVTTTKAKAHASYDKNMHCSTSCMLTLRCSSKHVLTIGYMKEFRDIFTGGNPEYADMMANRTGISIAVHKRAMSDSECLEQCDLHYVPHKPRH
jgi:hypothetical protein